MHDRIPLSHEERVALRTLQILSERGQIAPPKPDPDALDARLRAAYLAGAEEYTRATLGRGLTPDELAGVLRRFPG
jgi:hypothetical protein